MEYDSNTKTLFADCDEYSVLVTRHSRCQRWCFLPLDGDLCPCILSTLGHRKRTKVCLYDGVTTHHASRQVLMERNWCEHRRLYRQYVASDEASVYVEPPSVVFIETGFTSQSR
jgi:hypothetical protein